MRGVTQPIPANLRIQGVKHFERKERKMDRGATYISFRCFDS